ncbi:hypothetical protein EDB81DRAFT_824713 [Dactylonectria macrodidyma]|uniref:Uncharacterized protein n=1 Tax=Dactylonectria macrodidyma TaxID=307937 RepID=A0A9P9D6W7_9HYPO|nr:hypothetical protein EDB81DRAFT_824713 [Dactylonectria macrodidyma]
MHSDGILGPKGDAIQPLLPRTEPHPGQLCCWFSSSECSIPRNKVVTGSPLHQDSASPHHMHVCVHAYSAISVRADRAACVEDFDALSSARAAEIQRLTNSHEPTLHVAESNMSVVSSHTTDPVSEWNDFGISMVDKAEWTEVLDFMEFRAKEYPYPTYLYRAHVHGHPFPRWIDEFNGEYCDNYASDLHSWAEQDARTEIHVLMCDPVEYYTIDDLFSELGQHLNKTQICLQQQQSGEEPLYTRLVSLSGHFDWTTQKICKLGETTGADQVPGLALFESSVIKTSGVHIWRVKDMLAFFNNSRLKDSLTISSQLRRWAMNADEYVCWVFVPRDALVAFVSVSDLTQQLDDNGKAFLRKEFVSADNLAHMRRRGRERISLEEYTDRASRFLLRIFSNLSSWDDVKRLDVNIFANWVLNPFDWGYELMGFYEDLEEFIVSLIQTEFRKRGFLSDGDGLVLAKA